MRLTPYLSKIGSSLRSGRILAKIFKWFVEIIGHEKCSLAAAGFTRLFLRRNRHELYHVAILADQNLFAAHRCRDQIGELRDCFADRYLLHKRLCLLSTKYFATNPPG